MAETPLRIKLHLVRIDLNGLLDDKELNIVAEPWTGRTGRGDTRDFPDLSAIVSRRSFTTLPAATAT